MSEPPSQTVTTSLAPSRDSRLVPYCLFAIGGFGSALATGRPALAALGVPFALALAIGLARMGSLHVEARVSIDAEQVVEGDIVDGRISLEWDDPLDVQVLFHGLTGVSGVEPGDQMAWSLPAASGSGGSGGSGGELPFSVRAEHWGRHTIGEVWLRARGPFGLLRWEGRVAIAPTLRVLPSAERLTRLLDPSESRAVAGTHRSRRVGDGDEFAELRPYVPGDRLRDLNWGATARHHRPYVNRHHPELAGEVMIVVDAFVDGSAYSTEALARAARAAWAIASIHLQANDRVGLVGLGGRTQWLQPSGGRRAKYELLEMLLSIGGEIADRGSTRGYHLSVNVPASALVIALTPLHDRRTISMLQSWRARGRNVAVVMIDTRDLLGQPASDAEALARRVWSVQLDHNRHELTDVGIPVVTIAEDGPMAPAVSALRRLRQAPTLRRTS